MKAAALNSRLWGAKRTSSGAMSSAGELDLLYMAPGNAACGPRRLDRLKSARRSLIAIDEAHCLSQWGHDFRPEYRALDCLADIFPDAAAHRADRHGGRSRRGPRSSST